MPDYKPNSIKVFIYGFIFNCTTVGQAQDAMKTLS